jgi:hypothetical protein
VGGATERSLSPAPTAEEVVPTSTEEGRPEPSATTGAVEPVVAPVEEEAPAKIGLVDIASILRAPTMTVFRSNL